MKYSILISVYERESPGNLIACLESLRGEIDSNNSEIVIVKDGRLTLALDAVIEKYMKDGGLGLKVYGYPINKGLGYALNFGLERCQYELVFRMDADDLCVNGRIKKQLEKFKDDSIGIVGGQIEEFAEKIGDLNSIREVPLSDSEIKRRQFKRNPFNHMTVAFRKSLVQDAGGYQTMHGYEDYFLWIRLLKIARAENLKDVLVYARTDDSFIGRRMGFSLFKRELAFQYALFKYGYTSLIQLTLNLLFRAMPRLLPRSVVLVLYKRLRKS